MGTYKDLIVPEFDNINGMQSFLCQNAACPDVGCIECLFYEENIEAFKEWLAEKSRREDIVKEQKKRSIMKIIGYVLTGVLFAYLVQFIIEFIVFAVYWFLPNKHSSLIFQNMDVGNFICLEIIIMWIGAFAGFALLIICENEIDNKKGE